MNRIDLLKRKVQGLHEARSPGPADWVDWLYENHIFVVAEYAKELSAKHKVQGDLVTAAAMLHDIADSEMSRFNAKHEAKHEEQGREIAKTLLKESSSWKKKLKLSLTLSVIMVVIMANHPLLWKERSWRQPM